MMLMIGELMGAYEVILSTPLHPDQKAHYEKRIEELKTITPKQIWCVPPTNN